MLTSQAIKLSRQIKMFTTTKLSSHVTKLSIINLTRQPIELSSITLQVTKLSRFCTRDGLHYKTSETKTHRNFLQSNNTDRVHDMPLGIKLSIQSSKTLTINLSKQIVKLSSM